MRNSTTYKLAGPKTFRRSSSKLFDWWGGNVQNIEKSMRKMYIPDGFNKDMTERCKHWLKTGDYSVFTQQELETLRVLGQTDQSGAEALIVSYECPDGPYRSLFKNGIKPHVYIGMKLFKDIWTKELKAHGGLIEDFNIDEIYETPIPNLKSNPFWHELDLLIKSSDNWPTEKRYYYFAKQTCHSGNYDIQWAKFQLNTLEKSGGKVFIPRSEAERFLLIYRGEFPEIPERNRLIRRQVEETGYLFNIFGHPYKVEKWNISENDWKEYYAWSAQSSVGEITRTAFTQLYNWIWDNHKKWDILLDGHDSYVVQFPLYETKDAILKMKEFMNQKLIAPSDGSTFFMKSESQIGFNWAPYKSEENELGLREIDWI